MNPIEDAPFRLGFRGLVIFIWITKRAPAFVPGSKLPACFADTLGSLEAINKVFFVLVGVTAARCGVLGAEAGRQSVVRKPARVLPSRVGGGR